MQGRKIIIYIIIVAFIIPLIKVTLTNDFIRNVKTFFNKENSEKTFPERKLLKGECYIKLRDFDQVFETKKNPQDLNKNKYNTQDYHGSIIIRGNINNKYNLFFYGHNTYDGKMFSNLTKYQNRYLLLNSKGIDVKTNKTTEHYRIVFAKKINIQSENPWIFAKLNSYHELIRYKKYLKSQDDSFKINSHKLITLMTCTNEDEEDKRFFVVGERSKKW